MADKINNGSKTLYNNDLNEAIFYKKTPINYLEEVINKSPNVNLFDSIEFIHPSKFAYLLRVSKNSSQDGQQWSNNIAKILDHVNGLPQLTNEQLKRVRLLCEHQISRFYNATRTHNIVLVVPSLRATGNKCLVFLACDEKSETRTINLDDLLLFSKILPNLESIKLDMFYINTDKPTAVKDIYKIKYLDIRIPGPLDSEANFFTYVLKSYNSSLRSFNFERDEAQWAKDQSKWKKWRVRGLPDETQLKKCRVSLPCLKSLALNYLHYTSPVQILSEVLARSNCALEHFSIISSADPTDFLPNLMKDNYATLNKLSIVSHHEFDYRQLTAAKFLKTLHCRHCIPDKPVVIIDIMRLLPSLEELDVGFEGNLGTLRRPKLDSAGTYNLTKLTLSYICLKGSELSHLHVYIPHLSDITLSNCRIGRTESGSEERLSLKNYDLKTLIIENCKLYSARNDSKHPVIGKYKVQLTTDDKYEASITSKAKGCSKEEEYLSTRDSNTFCYTALTNRKFLAFEASTLKIYINTLKSLKCDKKGLNSIGFMLVKHKTDIVIDQAIQIGHLKDGLHPPMNTTRETKSIDKGKGRLYDIPTASKESSHINEITSVDSMDLEYSKKQKTSPEGSMGASRIKGRAVAASFMTYDDDSDEDDDDKNDTTNNYNDLDAEKSVHPHQNTAVVYKRSRTFGVYNHMIKRRKRPRSDEDCYSTTEEDTDARNEKRIQQNRSFIKNIKNLRPVIYLEYSEN
ncbi:MAG: hypothetical protein EXX96DRAFT_575386, partial [Benjaminiella poitrasii]